MTFVYWLIVPNGDAVYVFHSKNFPPLLLRREVAVWSTRATTVNGFGFYTIVRRLVFVAKIVTYRRKSPSAFTVKACAPLRFPINATAIDSPNDSVGWHKHGR